jgi:hypothetical protein
LNWFIIVVDKNLVKRRFKKKNLFLVKAHCRQEDGISRLACIRQVNNEKKYLFPRCSVLIVRDNNLVISSNYY